MQVKKTNGCHKLFHQGFKYFVDKMDYPQYSQARYWAEGLWGPEVSYPAENRYARTTNFYWRDVTQSKIKPNQLGRYRIYLRNEEQATLFALRWS